MALANDFSFHVGKPVPGPGFRSSLDFRGPLVLLALVGCAMGSLSERPVGRLVFFGFCFSVVSHHIPTVQFARCPDLIGDKFCSVL